MKFLLDEHTEGFDKKLFALGHEVEYAKKLKVKDEKFRNDFNLLLHAKDQGMIFITKDGENGQACEDNNIRCIWLSDDRIYDEMILPKLDKFEN